MTLIGEAAAAVTDPPVAVTASTPAESSWTGADAEP